MFDGQIVAITILVCIYTQSIPHWMQVAGLIFGIVGMAVLTLSDYLKLCYS